ncbi:LacI family DNA-binding transcriptional regulator, partial [Escherichia coli]
AARKSAGGITLRDVAQLAGVAPITASRALNTPSAVSPKVLQKVREAVEKTGYVPNLLATDLEDEKIDVGIMYRPEDCRRLDSHTIYAEPLLAVLPRGHRLAHKPEIS